ncbi:SDR family NAD(P)-dependent oxidoreductase [Roseomonas marmotae]|uniref:SDR family NAD(P)-dependent oxidoreductase n=1 Tax=Roseomonas marmotae TaxID=2768161 RepID=UPI0038D2279E
MTEHRSPSPWRDVAVTGASSGLGRALALACASPGARLHLAARNAARLEETAAACRAAGAEVTATRLDVRDADACEAWIAGMERIDLLLANAGVSGGTGGGTEPAAQTRAVFETNVNGVLNTALPAMARMAAQAPGPGGIRGRIGVIASIAAFVPAPSAPAYAASKAAVQRWAEATDIGQRGQGVRLHAICPGFIRTPMTDVNRFPMPFMLSPEEAARRALAGIRAGRSRVAYPRRTYVLARLAALLPMGLMARAARGVPPKDVSAG